MSELQRKMLAVLTLGIFAGGVYLLSTGSPWLVVEPFGLSELPLGTLITWAGIFSLPVTLTLAFHEFLSKKSRVFKAFRSLMTAVLTLCGSWGFVSYGLAGNWAFNFQNQSGSFQGSVHASKVFWTYSISIVAITLMTSAVLLATVLFSKRRGD